MFDAAGGCLQGLGRELLTALAVLCQPIQVSAGDTIATSGAPVDALSIIQASQACSAPAAPTQGLLACLQPSSARLMHGLREPPQLTLPMFHACLRITGGGSAAADCRLPVSVHS